MSGSCGSPIHANRGSRAAELSRARAGQALSEEDCLIWLGVGLATLERVEAGEIVPGAELEQRIDRFLQVCGGTFHSPHSTPPFTHGGGNLGAGAASPVPAPLSQSGGDDPCGAPIHADRGDDLCGAPIQSNRGAL